MSILHDLAGFSEFPKRVVSLVPSITESLFDLGLGKTLVGITDYCIYPETQLAGLPRLGGPRSLDIEAIFKLNPDLVIANQEENEQEEVEKLAASLAVWLAFPKTVDESLQDLWRLVYLFRNEICLERMRSLDTLVRLTENALDPETVGPRVFVPIWRQASEGDTPTWWMTFNDETYAGDLLRLFGGKNVFGGRQRKYPLRADLGLAPAEPTEERDNRYPRVSEDEVIAADPEFILLPDEPFAFGQADIAYVHQVFAATSAVRNKRIILVEGSLLTWQGTRVARAISSLSDIFLR